MNTNDIITRAREMRSQMEADAASFDDTLALERIEWFPIWNENEVEYKEGDRVRYEDLLYKCLQGHTSQSTWTPAAAVSIWVRVDNPAEEYPEWRQPTGATDAYPLGAKVSHNDKHWISGYADNVWEPGVFGWSEVI